LEYHPTKSDKISVESSNCYTVTWREWEVYQVSPSYPREAREKKIEGYVLIKLCFDTKGIVFGQEILESKPDGIFDKVVLDSVSKWRIRRIDGKPLNKNQCVKQKISMKMPKEGS